MIQTTSTQPPAGKEIATLGGGCFWCLEAVFDGLQGVESVESGYTGGKIANPTYQQVCNGDTGHAEVVRVTFDPRTISLKEVLEVFFAIHDPTTLNRQGNDGGTQYRSAVFYESPEQQHIAQETITEFTAAKVWDDPIVTGVAPLEKFWAAEEYHNDYFAQNPQNPYCAVVIAPKVSKARKLFLEKLAK